jgi:polar amino acid transport system substrate-binding protein
MRRYLGTFLTFCVAAGLLCGCVRDTDNSGESSAQLPELNIGIDANYEPYSYVDENGTYAGLDIELATEACARMGWKPVFNAIKWDNKDTYLEEGRIDCIWSCFSMNGREEDYDWVGPYMYSRQMVVVQDDSPIETISDLTDRTVAVISSTKPESIFLDQDGEHVPVVKDVYCMDNMDLVFAALRSGYADAAAGHETVLRQYMETASGSYRLLEEALLSVEVGIAFENGQNSDVAKELEQTLQEMKDDGTLERILEDYGVSTELPDGGELQ